MYMPDSFIFIACFMLLLFSFQPLGTRVQVYMIYDIHMCLHFTFRVSFYRFLGRGGLTMTMRIHLVYMLLFRDLHMEIIGDLQERYLEFIYLFTYLVRNIHEKYFLL